MHEFSYILRSGFISKIEKKYFQGRYLKSKFYQWRIKDKKCRIDLFVACSVQLSQLIEFTKRECNNNGIEIHKFCSYCVYIISKFISRK